MKEQLMSIGILSSVIKTVGKSGQISLGKSFAGKTLRLDRKADGTMILTAVAIVPESQLWTLQEPHRSAIAKGMAWAAKALPAETDLDSLAERQGTEVKTRKTRAAGR
jgi:hypothetical protein